MVNSEIRLIIFFAAKDGEALYSLHFTCEETGHWRMNWSEGKATGNWALNPDSPSQATIANALPQAHPNSGHEYCAELNSVDNIT